MSIRLGLTGLLGLMSFAGAPASAFAAPPTVAVATSVDAAQVPAPLPLSLAATGLYVDAARRSVDPAHLEFSPQYPLWSDGAAKRRWISLPVGTAIDGSDPDAWEFPPGTRLWKEFSLAGRPIETRFIERLADGRWRFAAYEWNVEADAALLVPEFGRSVAAEGAPGGRYRIPSRGDCQACHEGAPAPVLGFSALQLSPDRDPLAPHAEPAADAALDLPALVARGLLVNLPPELLLESPRIRADDPLQRAALGYLHGNCGHCHHRGSQPTGVPVDLQLAQSLAAGGDPAAVLDSLQGQARFRPRGWSGEPHLLVHGDPDSSVLLQRMRSRDPISQMPPLGTRLADAEALALFDRWIGRTGAPKTQGELP